MARPNVGWGLQDQAMSGARVWVLPDPSGLNRQTLAQLVAAYGALRVAAADDLARFSDFDGRKTQRKSERGSPSER